MTTAVPLCFVDTETDGVHPDRQAWEITLIRRDLGSPDRELHMMVNIDLATADPFGLRIGRFWDRHPWGRFLSGRSDRCPVLREVVGDTIYEADGPMLLAPSAAAPLVARWTHGAHLVGAVPDFDAHVLGRMLRDHALMPAWHYHLIDVETLAAGWAAAHGHTLTLPWDSDDLSTLAGVAPPDDADRHTSTGDARWARALYDHITTEPPTHHDPADLPLRGVQHDLRTIRRS
ncbi:MAG: hypothetical protein ACRCZP_20105 [Phycicoccus sp.]